MNNLVNESLVKRYIVFFIGVIINSFGIAFITKATLGTSPISSVPFVLSQKFPLSFGTISFAFNLLFIVAQMVLLKKDFEKIQFLQIVVNIIFSVAIDISMFILQFLNPEMMLMKLICLVVGCAILGFGITIEVAPDVLMVPGEGIVSAISKTFKKEFGSVKLCFDVTLMATALTLSLIFFHKLNGIGIGTIISSFLIGTFVKIFRKILKLN